MTRSPSRLVVVRTLIPSFVLACVAVVFAQGREPVTHEALWLMPRVGAPTLHPNGGHLVNWLRATTTRYCALVSHAGLVNSETQWATSDSIYGRELMNGGVPWLQAVTRIEQNPIRRAANFKTPILVSVGEKDFRVPTNNGLENWSVLQRMKVPSRLLVWPDENQWILNGANSRHFYSEVHAWLARWMRFCKHRPAALTTLRQLHFLLSGYFLI
jgi:prolyl oligopeptidase family protein